MNKDSLHHEYSYRAMTYHCIGLSYDDHWELWLRPRTINVLRTTAYAMTFDVDVIVSNIVYVITGDLALVVGTIRISLQTCLYVLLGCVGTPRHSEEMSGYFPSGLLISPA